MELKKKILKKKPSSRIQGLGRSKQKKRHQYLRTKVKTRKQKEAKAEQHSSITFISYRAYVVKAIVPFFRWAKRKTLLSFTNKYRKKGSSTPL